MPKVAKIANYSPFGFAVAAVPDTFADNYEYKGPTWCSCFRPNAHDSLLLPTIALILPHILNFPAHRTMITIADLGIAEQVASFLLDHEAVKLRPHQPFTWASGWLSPIYCDNRVTLSYPAVRSYIKESLYDLFESHYSGANVIAGVATAGIPMASLVADEALLPLCYVRSAPKGHGMQNLIEGRLPDDPQVLVIEDLISTGGSSLKAVEALRGAGANVLGMAAVFTYGFDVASEAFATSGTDLVALTDYVTLVRVALDKKIIQDADLELLTAWRADPAGWGR